MPIFEITPVQRKALEALEWLYDNDEKNRRTGRSTVLALSYLRRLLLAGPGMPSIHVEDHYDGGVHSDHQLARFIIELGRQIGCNIDFDSRCNVRLTPDTRITQDMIDAVTFTISSSEYEVKVKPRTLWEYLKDED
jgi:hypothetical protein